MLIVWNIFALKIFLDKGIESGIENWGCCASLFGFLIPLAFSLIVFIKLKKVK
ncbi:hypothetical protein PI23P_08245 [Polaribacter irgensii 23-P]|uniref:Uncharacterized protein n=1 Tax=Polaribacter irgensii 23-P TaxID=313594 RepID=A4BZK8_9FLAO|nr:hypothetical protein PI23P_08245 [Polaribacter irgensii 23-P]